MLAWPCSCLYCCMLFDVSCTPSTYRYYSCSIIQVHYSLHGGTGKFGFVPSYTQKLQSTSMYLCSGMVRPHETKQTRNVGFRGSPSFALLLSYTAAIRAGWCWVCSWFKYVDYNPRTAMYIHASVRRVIFGRTSPRPGQQFLSTRKG